MLLAALELSWFGTLMVLWILLFAAHHYWTDIFSRQGVLTKVSFRSWLLKGWAGSLVGWLLINSKLLPGFTPVHPDAYEALRLTISPVSTWLNVLRPSFGIITAIWCITTFLWLLCLIFLHHKDRQTCRWQLMMWSFIWAPVAGMVGALGGPEGLPYASLCILIPLTHVTRTGVDDRVPVPMYARAIARIKLGKYGEAEAEVIRQLEKCENDVEGWLMLADLYAHHFKELPEADRTIRELCNLPQITQAEATVALHRLADWHLQLSDDPKAAASALQEIVQRFPDTHFARMAAQRIQRLPASKSELQEQRQPKELRLPSLSENTTMEATENVPKADAIRRCNELVERLKRNPNDPVPREELALLLARSLSNPKMAIEQLELLLNLPEATENQKAEWLALKAVWEETLLSDLTASANTLQSLIRLHPRAPQARAARRKLEIRERKGLEQSHAQAASARPIRIRVDLSDIKQAAPEPIRSSQQT